MNQKEFDIILKKHNKWLKGEEGGEQATLECEDLSKLCLKNVNLRKANLFGADLGCVDLSHADLSNCNLATALLSGCKIAYTNLKNANLESANLISADLESADLRGCNLDYTLFDYANLTGVKLDDSEMIRLGRQLNEPIIGFKKCKDVIVKLEIPEGAMVFSVNNSKCRTNKCRVVEIIGGDRAYAPTCDCFSYYVGDIFNIKNFDCRYNIEESRGIHFYRTREEAENE